MMHPDAARSLLFDRARPLPTIPRMLSQSPGYVLAEPVCADRDIPPADRAAMDGYALRYADVQTVPAELEVAGEVAAGSSRTPSLAAGQCARIFTGAVVPDDADTVVMQERTDSAAGENGSARVRILAPPKEGQHIFRRGENGREGEVLIHTGTCLNSLHTGICAMVGAAQLKVFRKPRTAVLTTGKELRDTADPVGSHQIRDANGDAISALLAEHDVLLITGGVSVGKYDLVPGAVRQIGGEILYHGIAIKPGKPQLCAVLPDGKFIFGLPGNPLSSLVGLHEFALPAIRRLAGHPRENCYSTTRFPLAEPVSSKGKRQHQQLASILSTDSGPRILPVRHTGSSDLIAAGQAQGMLIVPKGICEIPAGELVEYRSWTPGI